MRSLYYFLIYDGIYLDKAVLGAVPILNPMNKRLETFSKFLSLVLRHKPEAIGIELDEHGWAEVEQLLHLAARKGTVLSRSTLIEIVETNNKKRFSFNADQSKIRANQGHSIEVDLQLVDQPPPNILYHGTATQFISSIQQKGLLPQSRQHVHLSADKATAIKVGRRHGKPVVLRIKATELSQSGTEFFLSANGVWLTKHVPASFIEFPD